MKNLGISTLLFVLLFSSPSYGKIFFLTSKSAEWEANVLRMIDGVNQILPQGLEKPDTFIIAYVAGAEASYASNFNFMNPDGVVERVDRVLTVGDHTDPVFVHEYGHVILDYYLRKHSKAWQHFVISQKVFHDPIAESLESHREGLLGMERGQIKYQELLKEDPENEFAQGVLEMTSGTIEKYRKLIPLLEYALKIEQEAGHSFHGSQAFQSYLPLSELFADTITALYFDDWSIMEKTLKEIYQAPDGLKGVMIPPSSSDEEAIALLSGHRSFLPNIDLEDYDFQDWESLTPYEQLRPARSFIRSLYDNEWGDSEIIDSLALGILAEYEEVFVPLAEIDSRSLYQKNQSIIERLRAQ